MLEYDPNLVNEPYLTIAKECLDIMVKNEMPIERINNVISCINCLVRWSYIPEDYKSQIDFKY